MITQYTRLIVKISSGAIEHCTSQDYPFADNWEPIEYDVLAHQAIDFEIDTDYPDSNFTIGVDQQMIRARELIDNLEILSGQPAVKADASTKVSDKILRISAPKSIEETAIRAEIIAAIKTKLNAAGSSEGKLLAEMGKAVPDMPDILDGLGTLKLIRINRAL